MLEVTVGPAATEVELKEMKDDLKDFIEKNMIIKTSSIEAEQKNKMSYEGCTMKHSRESERWSSNSQLSKPQRQGVKRRKAV